MKRILKAALLVVAVMVLSGCVKYRIDMNIGKDKSVDLGIIYMMDTSFADSMNPEETPEETTEETEEERPVNVPVEEETTMEMDSIDPENFKFLEEKGFKVEPYTEKIEEKNYEGVKISKTYPNIDDITSENPIIFDFTKMMHGQQNVKDNQLFTKDGEKYVANFVFDMSETAGETQEGMPDMSSMMDMKYVLTLPYPALTHNATSVSEDLKTLTWTLGMKKNEVNFTFSLDTQLISGIDNNILFVGAGIFVVALILIIVIAKSRGNKGTSADQTTVSNVDAQMGMTQEPLAPTMNVEPAPVQEPVMSAMNVEPAPVQEPVMPTMNVEPAPVQEPVMPTMNVEPAPVQEPVTPTMNVEPAPVQEPNDNSEIL